MADKLCECLKEQLVADRVLMENTRLSRAQFEEAGTCEGCGKKFLQLFEDIITGSKYCNDCFIEANAL